MSRTQYAPRLLTIGIALVFSLVGVLGTLGGLLPSVGSVSGEQLGVAAFVIADALLLLGVFFRRI